MMETVRLGLNGPEVSRLAMGCWAIGGHGWGQVDDQESTEAIRRAVDIGVTFFDTADCYGLGHSEGLLAKALGPDRHGVVIASKFGVRWNDRGEIWRDTSPTYLRTALEGSLRRLRLDCIPLYYVHWPDGETPIEETMGELERCRQEGKIRWIGLSNHSVDEIHRAQRVAQVSAIQHRYSLVHRRHAEAIVRKVDIPVVAWGALGEGLLTGKYHVRSIFGPEDHRSRSPDFQGERFLRLLDITDRVSRMARERRVSAAQIALRWVLQQAGIAVALFGAKTAGQVEENVNASSFRLTEAECQVLRKIAEAAEESPSAEAE